MSSSFYKHPFLIPIIAGSFCVVDFIYCNHQLPFEYFFLILGIWVFWLGILHKKLALFIFLLTLFHLLQLNNSPLPKKTKEDKFSLSRVDASRNHISSQFQQHPHIRILIDVLILGFKKSLSLKLQFQLRQLGIVHLFVISGVHLIFVVGFIKIIIRPLLLFIYFKLSLFKKYLPFLLETALLCSGALLFTLLSGLQIPTLRALTFYLMGQMLKWQAKKPAYFHNLSLTILIVHTLFPALLINISWLLSLIAATSFIAHNQFIPNPQKSTYFKLFIRPMYISLLTISCLMPVSLYFFDQISFWGFIHSFLQGAIIGFIVLPLLLLLTIIALCGLTPAIHIPLQLIEKLAGIWLHSLSSLPKQNWLILEGDQKQNGEGVFLFYLILFCFFVWLDQKKSPQPEG